MHCLHHTTARLAVDTSLRQRLQCYLGHVLCLMCISLHCNAAPPVSTQSRDLWQAYVKQFVQADGRVLESGIQPNTTSSEAQAYTMLMSLVANDRAIFDLVLNWTDIHLAQKDLKQHLPGWSWGKREDGEWTLLDRNAASDADLWLAYTLFQASELWQEPRYEALGAAVLKQIKQKEIMTLPALGEMLIPGPEGFHHDGVWRINPSYLPLQILRYFEKRDSAGPWSGLIRNTLKLYTSLPKKLAPDWLLYKDKRWFYDENTWAIGSYDAIRTYLWAGMLHPQDPEKARLLRALIRMSQVIEVTQVPPHQINIVNGDLETGAPVGFSAAVIPYLKSLGLHTQVKRQQQALKKAWVHGLLGSPPRYYDQVLALFGLGWEEGYFSFAADGSLKPWWHTDHH